MEHTYFTYSPEVAHAVAIEFSNVLKDWLTDEQFALIKDADKNYPDDYCDANMAIAEAFTTITGRAFTFYNDDVPESKKQNEYDTNLFNNAWEIAKDYNFFYDKPRTELTLLHTLNKLMYQLEEFKEMPSRKINVAEINDMLKLIQKAQPVTKDGQQEKIKHWTRKTQTHFRELVDSGHFDHADLAEIIYEYTNRLTDEG